MATAFVLVSCDYGQEKRIIDEMRSMVPVKHVEETLGAYEIVAELESNSTERIKEAVKDGIGKMNCVRSIMTLFVN